MPNRHRLCVILLGLGVVCVATSALAAEDDPLDGLVAPTPTKAEELKGAPVPDDDIDGVTKKKAKSEDASATTAPAALDRVKAVPRKTMMKRSRFELSPFMSASLNDSYYQHLAAAGSAIFYPHDAFGLGVGIDWLYANIKSDSIDAVRENLTSVPAVFLPPRMFAHLDFYWVPVYGKLSLFDSQILHFDIYATAGMGMAFAGERRLPLASLGVGQRFVLTDFLALRFEVRDNLFLDSQLVEREGVGTRPRSDIQSYVMLLAGVSLFLPTSFEYTYQ